MRKCREPRVKTTTLELQLEALKLGLGRLSSVEAS